MNEQEAPSENDSVRGFVEGFIEAISPENLGTVMNVLTGGTSILVKLARLAVKVHGHAVDAATARLEQAVQAAS